MKQEKQRDEKKSERALFSGFQQCDCCMRKKRGGKGEEEEEEEEGNFVQVEQTDGQVNREAGAQQVGLNSYLLENINEYTVVYLCEGGDFEVKR